MADTSMAETTQELPGYFYVFVAAALSFVWWMAYNYEYPNEPLEHAPKNIQVGSRTDSAQTLELEGLTRFRMSKGSINFSFQESASSSIKYMSFGCTHAYKSLPHYWRALRRTRVTVLADSKTIVSIENLEQNITYNFSQVNCQK